MTRISRRAFLASASVAAADLVGVSRAGYPLGVGRVQDTMVETAYGKLRGVREAGVSIFRGVPYAGRVSGDRRFRRPAPLQSWTGVRDALRLGPPSIQLPHSTYGLNEPPPDEDCLVLGSSARWSVDRPTRSASRPNPLPDRVAPTT